MLMRLTHPISRGGLCCPGSLPPWGAWETVPCISSWSLRLDCEPRASDTPPPGGLWPPPSLSPSLWATALSSERPAEVWTKGPGPSGVWVLPSSRREVGPECRSQGPGLWGPVVCVHSPRAWRHRGSGSRDFRMSRGRWPQCQLVPEVRGQDFLSPFYRRRNRHGRGQVELERPGRGCPHQKGQLRVRSWAAVSCPWWRAGTWRAASPVRDNLQGPREGQGSLGSPPSAEHHRGGQQGPWPPDPAGEAVMGLPRHRPCRRRSGGTRRGALRASLCLSVEWGNHVHAFQGPCRRPVGLCRGARPLPFRPHIPGLPSKKLCLSGPQFPPVHLPLSAEVHRQPLRDVGTTQSPRHWTCVVGLGWM